MDYILAWLKNLFNPSRWGRKAQAYQRRIEHKVREKTVGRAQASLKKKEQALDQKVWNAQDKVLERDKKNR